MVTRRSPIPTPAPVQPPDDAAIVLRQFRQVLNTVKTHFQQVEKKVGIGGAQVWALSVIRAQPGIGVGGLAQAMDIHQSTASNLVRSLAGRTLIEARKEAADRRSVQLYLLPAGQKVLRAAPGPFSGVLPSALGQLDATTLRRLRTDLDKLLVVLNADERAGQIPLANL